MKLFRSMTEWQNERQKIRGSVGFVPTMGALHAGHASLLERSVKQCDVTVLSIYVNPTQFNNPDDLANYPDTLDADLALAKTLGVDYVILPRYEAIYADGFRYSVQENEVSNELCGAHRQGHFTGVLTVVMRLLNIVRADYAFFGEKDYQQFELIRDMCDAFFMPVTIVPCPTVREADGLAMSSRNSRLTPEQRDVAGELNVLLRSKLSDKQIAKSLRALGFRVDYIISRAGRRFAAATLGVGESAVRLIDNVALAYASATAKPKQQRMRAE